MPSYPTVERTITFFKCTRCDAEFLPKTKGKAPMKCPDCMSIYWHKPYVRKEYEQAKKKRKK